MRVVYTDGAERGANPRAAQASALVRVGDFLVLTLLSPRSAARGSQRATKESPGERLVVAGRFPSQSQALSALPHVHGWSLVAQVEALPQMEDGYPLAVEVWHCEPFPGETSGRRSLSHGRPGSSTGTSRVRA
jgi:hypothetical protein